MDLSRVEGEDELFLGGLMTLRWPAMLAEKGITHILSLVGFELPPISTQPEGRNVEDFHRKVIDVDDMEDTELLVQLPGAVKFIDEGLRGDLSSETSSQEDGGVSLKPAQERPDQVNRENGGGVLVHCVAGKSRSVAVVIAYLLWRYPTRFVPLSKPLDPTQPVPPGKNLSRRNTGQLAVEAALDLVRQSRRFAEPNSGFMEQLILWWEMGCPEDVTSHPNYQKWVYKSEVEQSVAACQAPERLRFEDQEQATANGAPRTGGEHPDGSEGGLSLRCKKCRRILATGPYVQPHRPSKKKISASRPTSPPAAAPAPCPHFFIEPLEWMRGELEKGQLSGRLVCLNERCGAGVGRYDWKGLRCACGDWITPGVSLQRARVDKEVRRWPPPSSPKQPPSPPPSGTPEDNAARRKHRISSPAKSGHL